MFTSSTFLEEPLWALAFSRPSLLLRLLTFFLAPSISLLHGASASYFLSSSPVLEHVSFRAAVHVASSVYYSFAWVACYALSLRSLVVFLASPAATSPTCKHSEDSSRAVQHRASAAVLGLEPPGRALPIHFLRRHHRSSTRAARGKTVPLCRCITAIPLAILPLMTPLRFPLALRTHSSRSCTLYFRSPRHGGAFSLLGRFTFLNCWACLSCYLLGALAAGGNSCAPGALGDAVEYSPRAASFLLPARVTARVHFRSDSSVNLISRGRLGAASRRSASRRMRILGSVSPYCHRAPPQAAHLPHATWYLA